MNGHRYALFDNFVGANKESARNGQAEGVGRFNVDHQFELGWLQDRHFCRFRSFQNLSNVLPGLAVHPADAWAIARERASFGKLPITLPSTVVVDRQGRIAAAYYTRVYREDLTPLVKRIVAEQA